MPAGPSEVLVIADKHANPAHIAADLLSQVLTFCHCLLIEWILFLSSFQEEGGDYDSFSLLLLLIFWVSWYI